MPHTAKLQNYFNSRAFLQGQSSRFASLKIIVEDLVNDIHQNKAASYGLQLPNSDTVRLVHGCSSCNSNVAPARVFVEQFAQNWLTKSKAQTPATTSALQQLQNMATATPTPKQKPKTAQRQQRNRQLLQNPQQFRTRRRTFKSS